MKPIITPAQGNIVGTGFFISLNVASEDVGHFRCDDDLELTSCSWLQADHAHICVGVVEVVAF